MAGESMRDIKARIRSVESTMQITKALELVASSRLRGARERADAVRPYFTAMREAMRGALSSAVKSKYTQSSDSGKTCYIVIAGDRGLAGGYNNNVYKKLFETYSDGDVILPIGKKAVEYFRYHNIETINDDYVKAAGVTNSDCMEIAKKISHEFSEGTFSSVYIIYTEFRSVLSHVPVLLPVLPLKAEKQETKSGAKMLMLYEPSPEAVLSRIVPQYIAALLSGALAQSITSELASRRIAMEAASSNASEIIDSLNLKYNRARQASITQELTEIMSAADAQQ